MRKIKCVANEFKKSKHKKALEAKTTECSSFCCFLLLGYESCPTRLLIHRVAATELRLLLDINSMH